MEVAHSVSSIPGQVRSIVKRCFSRQSNYMTSNFGPAYTLAWESNAASFIPELKVDTHCSSGPLYLYLIPFLTHCSVHWVQQKSILVLWDEAFHSLESGLMSTWLCVEKWCSRCVQIWGSGSRATSMHLTSVPSYSRLHYPNYEFRPCLRYIYIYNQVTRKRSRLVGIPVTTTFCGI